MTPLDIITLNQAKTYLVMTGNDSRDAEITLLIKACVSLVEQYTCYRLYERTEMFKTYSDYTELPYYPITITSVKNSDDVDVDYKETFSQLSLNIRCKSQSIITATVGYSDVANVPPTLLQACYKALTYFFDNKDVYSLDLPVDIQALLNQWRRSATV